MFGINTYNFCSGIQTSISGIQAYTGSRVGSKVPGFGSQVRIRHPRPGTLVPTLELQLSDPKHGTLNPKPEPHALNPHLSKTDTETGLGRQSASRRQTAADAKFTNRDQWSRWFFWLISGVFMTRFHDRLPLNWTTGPDTGLGHQSAGWRGAAADAKCHTLQGHRRTPQEPQAQSRCPQTERRRGLSFSPPHCRAIWNTLQGFLTYKKMRSLRTLQ